MSRTKTSVPFTAKMEEPAQRQEGGDVHHHMDPHACCEMAAWRPRPRHTRHEARSASTESGAAIIASGDGAGPTKTEKAAGWGGVLYAPEGVQRSAPSVDLKAGPIVCEPGQPGYRGAKAPTNNAAELEAIEQMIVAAATLAAEMGFVEVHSDSRLAIMAALGIPRKTKKKRRQPRGQQSGGTNGVNDALATRAREAPLHERGKSCMGA